MHTGIENHRTEPGLRGRQWFLQRERPGPVLLSLEAGRIAQHAHWHERRDLPTCSRPFLKVKTLKIEEQDFDRRKKKGRELHMGRFWAKMEGWKEQNKRGQNIGNLFLLGCPSLLSLVPHYLPSFSGLETFLARLFEELWKDNSSFLVKENTPNPGKLM